MCSVKTSNETDVLMSSFAPSIPGDVTIDDLIGAYHERNSLMKKIEDSNYAFARIAEAASGDDRGSRAGCSSVDALVEVHDLRRRFEAMRASHSAGGGSK